MTASMKTTAVASLLLGIMFACSRSGYEVETDGGQVETDGGQGETDGRQGETDGEQGDLFCGNGRIDGPETCDSGELSGKSCVSLGFVGGSLKCGPDCRFDTSGCALSFPGRVSLAYGTQDENFHLRSYDTLQRAWAGHAQVKLVGTVLMIQNRIRQDDGRLELMAVRTATATELRFHLLSFTPQQGLVLDASEVSTVSMEDGLFRSFDLQFEALSGEALLVYSDGSNNPRYRTYTGQNQWSDPMPIFTSPPGTGVVRWMELVAHPFRDQMTLGFVDDTSNVFLVVWDGNQFLQQSVFSLGDTGSAQGKPWGMAYEQTTGDLAGIVGNACCVVPNSFMMADGTSIIENKGLESNAMGNQLLIHLVAQLKTDRVLYLSKTGCTNLRQAGSWNRGTEAFFSQVDNIAWTSASFVGTDPAAVVAFSTVLGQQIFQEQLNYVTWSLADGWTEDQILVVPGVNYLRFPVLVSLAVESRVFAVFGDASQNLFAFTYDPNQEWQRVDEQSLTAEDLSAPDVPSYSLAVYQE